jgi:predicted DNA-binding antitoxin AbrB/MazE fold protein
MEKKGNIFNQLAIISDLLERVNLKESEQTNVVFVLKENDFNEIFDKVSKRANKKLEETDDTFSVIIGIIKFIFSKSNV